MTTAFTSSFFTTMQFLMVILGGVSAVVLCVAVVSVAASILASVFDVVTRMIAKRWKKKGKRPRGKIGKIILRSVQEDGNV